MSSDRRPVVWCPHFDGRVDLTDASRYGEIRVIFRHEIFPDTADEVAPRSVARASDQLANFDPDVDFLCLSGSPLYMVMCALVLGRMFPGRSIRVLRYDRIEQGYYEVLLTAPIEERIDGD